VSNTQLVRNNCSIGPLHLNEGLVVRRAIASAGGTNSDKCEWTQLNFRLDWIRLV